jgi:hypothetical protein
VAWRCSVLQLDHQRIPVRLRSDEVGEPAVAAPGRANAVPRLPRRSAPVGSTRWLQAWVQSQAPPESVCVALLVLLELWLPALHSPQAQEFLPGSEPEGRLLRGAQLVIVGSGAGYADAAAAALAEPRQRVQVLVKPSLRAAPPAATFAALHLALALALALAHAAVPLALALAHAAVPLALASVPAVQAAASLAPAVASAAAVPVRLHRAAALRARGAAAPGGRSSYSGGAAHHQCRTVGVASRTATSIISFITAL